MCKKNKQRARLRKEIEDLKMKLTFSDILASKPTEPPVAPGWYDGVYKKEGINPMCKTNMYGIPAQAYAAPIASAAIVNPQTETDKQRDYLLSRLDDVFHDRNTTFDLRKMFHLDVDNRPKDGKELIERIKKGDFTIDEKQFKNREDFINGEEIDDDDWFGKNPLFGIVWNGPKADSKGYHAALKEREEAYKAAKDTIWVKSPEDGLAAVEAFKDWKPTNAPKQ